MTYIGARLRVNRVIFYKNRTKDVSVWNERIHCTTHMKYTNTHTANNNPNVIQFLTGIIIIIINANWRSGKTSLSSIPSEEEVFGKTKTILRILKL